MLYPAQIGVYSATTVEEWTSVLDLAAKWKFESIRTFATTQLASLASPIDKIVLGRRHNILNWLPDAYQAVCERPDALTLEEAKLLGMEDVVKISSLRQDIRPNGFKTTISLTLSVDVLRETFGLESPSELGPPTMHSDEAKAEIESCVSSGGSECAEKPVSETRWGGFSPDVKVTNELLACAGESVDNMLAEPVDLVGPVAVQPKTDPWDSWTSGPSPSAFGASEPDFLRSSSSFGSAGRGKSSKRGRR